MFQDYIKEHNLISDEQLKAAINLSITARNTTFYRVLMDSEYLTQNQVVDWACDYFGMGRIKNPFHSQVNWEQTAKLYPLDSSKERQCNVPLVIAQRQFCLKSESAKLFCLHEASDETTKNKMQSLLGGDVTFLLLTDEEYAVLLEYQLKPRKYTTSSASITAISGGVKADENRQLSALEVLLDELLTTALDWRATDLRILPLGATQAEVSMTVDGQNLFYTTIDTSLLGNLRNILKNRAMASEKMEKKPVEGKISFSYQGKIIDIRINIVAAHNGYDFNFRFITKSLLTIEDLGMSPENLKKYKRILNLTKGLVIISGPTGSGKTSLLYAGFRVALKEGMKIYSIEDPVEINLPGITQVEVNELIGLGKSTLFNSALRHRPDILAIGEIRDVDDAKPAINFAHTGHPAHATLHSNDAAGVIARLVNMGVDAYVLGDTLAAVIAQRLIRRICPNCAESYLLEADHPWRRLFHLGEDTVELKKAAGCAHCAGTGYYGQMAINEIILTTSHIRRMIQERRTRSEIDELLKADGFQSYLDDGIRKALAGETTFLELEKIANDLL